MVALEGSCLCGAVRYRAAGPAGPLGHCHCPTCRKAHGAAFATVTRVSRSGFEWVTGRELLSHYESSPGKKRFFCSRCGSQLVAAWDDESEVILRVGSLDSDPGSLPVAHVWTEVAAPWYEINGHLPCVPRGRDRSSAGRR